MGDAFGEGIELLSLGVLCGHQGLHGEAAEFFARARITFASVEEDDGEIKALDGLMKAYVMQDKFEEAKTACMDARELYTRNGLPMSEICARTWERVQH